MVTEEKVKLDYKSFEEKLGSWGEKLRPFIEGKEMWDIMDKIKNDAWHKDGNRKERIVPESRDTFRAFSTTNIKDIKVIFYLQDPYPRLYKDGTCQATGIAMDCRNSPNGKLQPSLDLWYEAIEREIGKKVKKDKSLEYLHEQGVMLLNTDLTCKLNKTGSHEGLWTPFHKYLLEEVLGSYSHIVYVLCGKTSQRMKRYICPFARVFNLEHPAAAAHRNGDWDSEGIFNKVNQILRENNTLPIMWDKTDWDEYKEPPF